MCIADFYQISVSRWPSFITKSFVVPIHRTEMCFSRLVRVSYFTCIILLSLLIALLVMEG